MGKAVKFPVSKSKQGEDMANNHKDIAPTKREDQLIVNPYQPINLETGNWFYREDVIEKIKDIFKRQPENKFILLRGGMLAGKTSTLKHIENSSRVLGENYIPVYLTPGDYRGLDPDNLLSFIYGAICEKLKSLGKVIPALDNIKERFIKGQTVASYLLAVDNYLEKDDVLVIIVDEFDQLLEKAAVKPISQFISFFQYMERSWRNYALIIAGDKSPINLTTDDTINRFLQTAAPIEIDEFLEEETAKKYIIEPLCNHIDYDIDAIRAILWYTGKHAYFLELVCYYIVETLLAREGNHCSREDVEKAIQRILKDSEGKKRPEFAFAWENKMSMEIRLTASALMDDSITVKKKDNYVIEENNLLDNIFDEGMNREIEKFPGISYFNRMENRKFSQFPMKIPLLGLWIQKEHPFIKTIIEHIHMECIADRVDMGTINEEIRKAPSNKLPPFGREAILEISRNWRLLEDSITGTPRKLVKSHIEHFREGLSQLLNLGIIEPKSNGNYFVMDIKTLNIGILEEAFCFIQDRPGINEKDIFNIENIATSVAQDTKTQLTLYFYIHKSSMVEELVEKTYLNLVSIDSNDLKKIVFSKWPRDTLRNIILAYLTLQKVSPYQITGPAKATFYGRTDIINQISRTIDTSYAIVGARKIGKTSLLHKVMDNPPPNTYYIFMNLDPKFKGASTYNPFLKSLEEKVAETFYQKVNLVRLTTGKSLSRLIEVIRELSQKGKKIIFVFDEVDAFIKFDSRREYKLLHTFRTLSQNDYCQFILAGFKTLYHRKREIENPLYNFTTEIMLQPLEREAALDLITKPMESIGVHYQDEKDIELILGYTARHPNLLQFFCDELIKKIEKHANAENRRTIFKSDIQDLYNHTYEDYIMDQIYMFYSDLTDMNRLTLILMVEEQSKQPGEVTFTPAKTCNKLSEVGIEVPLKKIHRDLKNLVMRFILLEKGKDNYGFALPDFPSILGKRIDTDLKKALIKGAKKEIKIDPESV